MKIIQCIFTTVSITISCTNVLSELILQREENNTSNLRSRSLAIGSKDESVKPQTRPSAVSSIEGDGRFVAMETFYSIDSVENSKLLSEINWPDVLLMIFMYDNPKVDELISAHYETWLKRVGKGADIVFVTDITDKRSDDKILPLANTIEASSHVYKSSAMNEGKHLRYKVIDAFRYVGENFRDKKFFLKLDTDTFVVAENLLDYLKELYVKSYPKPAYFGYAVCPHFVNTCDSIEMCMCYGAGSGYGFNAAGLKAVNDYFAGNPEILTEQHKHPRYDRNLLVHEDYMMGVAYARATHGFPIVHNRLMFPYPFDRYGPGFQLTKRNAVSYHKVMTKEDFIIHDRIFHHEDGTRRTFDEIDQMRQTTSK